MSELRVGVVGVNGIGQAHLWALHTAERSVLGAVCDIDPERAAKAGADHKVEAFTDAEALCRAGVVDAVVVATPPGTHGPLVRAVLDAGLHVYCEKPIAPTADEGYALAARAKEARRVLAVGFQFRFHAGYRALRDAIAEIGRLVRVDVVANNWFRPQRYFDAGPWRATWRVAGGGVLMSQAIHQLDLLALVAGMPARVTASVACRRHRAEVEDEAIALLEWESGGIGTLVASLNEPAGREQLEFVGETGIVSLRDGYSVRRTAYPAIQTSIDECADEFPVLEFAPEPIDVARSPSEEFDMFVDAHRSFAAAALDGAAPFADAYEGTRAVELANAIYLSAHRGEPVALPLEPGHYPALFEELATARIASGPHE